VRLAEACAPPGHAEKRMLRELTTYLRGLMTMQNHTSNLVGHVAGSLDLRGRSCLCTTTHQERGSEPDPNFDTLHGIAAY
jgi:hypothetical protein